MLGNNLLRVRRVTGGIDSGLRRTLTGYYGATAGFLLLDLGFGLNFRVAFLEGYDGWRFAYYAICFACLAVVLARPAWTVAVTAVESLVTIVALIFSVALPTLVYADSAFTSAGGLPGLEGIVNFAISGSAAYLSWTRSLAILFGR